MKLYSENESYKLYQGNMLDMLEIIEPETIDSIVTDPPYELNFMNKGWDNSGIAFQPDTWKKCYEALKPGGYLLAFGGSRTFHRIACAIEDAGFEIRDTIMWLYGSGFPKSMDISKQLDKRNGRNVNKDFMNYLINNRKKKNLSTIQVAELGGWYGSTNHGGSVSNWEKGANIPTKEQYKKLKTILDLDNSFDDFINISEAEREIINNRNVPSTSYFTNYNEKIETTTKKFNDTLPSTDLAKQWQGWGTALKPSFEPIIVARKPFKGSLVDNVIEYGVGGINIDECRVGFSANEPDNRVGKQDIQKGASKNPFATGISDYDNTTYKANSRFPANTILTYDETDFDEVCGGFPYTKSNYEEPNDKHSFKGNKNAFKWGFKNRVGSGFNDSGSASRYFMNCKYTRKDEDFRRYIYTPKASKKDRDEGLDTFNQEKVNDGRQTPIDNAFQRGETLRKNIHPTVKPTDLMQYLIRLVSPDGATILDPFNGSGSTGKAVMYENYERNKDYKYIGIELTEEYLPISKARIEYVCNLKLEINSQMSIFDLEESR